MTLQLTLWPLKPQQTLTCTRGIPWPALRVRVLMGWGQGQPGNTLGLPVPITRYYQHWYHDAVFWLWSRQHCGLCISELGSTCPAPDSASAGQHHRTIEKVLLFIELSSIMSSLSWNRHALSGTMEHYIGLVVTMYSFLACDYATLCSFSLVLCSLSLLLCHTMQL